MLVRKLQEVKISVLCLMFLQNHEIVLEYVFVFLQAIVDKSEFTYDYSLQLTIAISYLTLWDTCFCQEQLV